VNFGTKKKVHFFWYGGSIFGFCFKNYNLNIWLFLGWPIFFFKNIFILQNYKKALCKIHFLKTFFQIAKKKFVFQFSNIHSLACSSRLQKPVQIPAQQNPCILKTVFNDLSKPIRLAELAFTNFSTSLQFCCLLDVNSR